MLQEWQLWMHPYPMMVKNQVRRVNPTLVPFKQVFNSEREFVRISDLIEGRKRRSPPQLKRCVRAVVAKVIKEKGEGGVTREDMSRAFAICTKQLQKTGFIKVGTNEPTKKGATRSRSKAGEKGHGSKVAEYERMLGLARGEE